MIAGNERSLVPQALAAIDPSLCGYDDWLAVGMALHAEGYPCQAWDAWSARDQRPGQYVPGQCEKKWRTFKQGGGVNGGSIVAMARAQGWEPEADRGRALAWDAEVEAPPAYAPEAAMEQARRAQVPDWTQWAGVCLDVAAEPLQAPQGWDGAADLATYLRAVFAPSDVVGFVVDAAPRADGKLTPASRGDYTHTAAQIVEAVEAGQGPQALAHAQAGAWIRFNPLDGQGVNNANVAAHRLALVESDTMDPAAQLAKIRALNLPCAAIVHSGGKSVHALVRVDAGNAEEYAERVAFLYGVCEANGLAMDPANKNASRLSRMPGATRDGAPQWLIATNEGPEGWDAWRSWLDSRRAAIQAERDAQAAAQERAEEMAGLGVVDPLDVVSALYSDFCGDGRDPWPTGFAQLDAALDGGLRGLTILGAISSLGKTTLCLQMADQMAAQGRPVLFVTAEQSAEELAAKSLSRMSREGGVTVDSFTATDVRSASRRAQWGESRYAAFAAACERYSAEVRPCLRFMEPRRQPDAAQIRQAAEAMAAEFGRAPAVFVDYLQLLAPMDERDTDKRAVDRNVLALRQLARDTGAPVVAVSSLNRNSYSGIISMESFKESGAIEYGADVLMGLQPYDMKGKSTNEKGKFSEEKADNYTEKHRKDPAPLCELAVLKNRNGGIPAAPLAMQHYKVFSWFVDRPDRTDAAVRGEELDPGEDWAEV